METLHLMQKKRLEMKWNKNWDLRSSVMFRFFRWIRKTFEFFLPWRCVMLSIFFKYLSFIDNYLYIFKLVKFLFQFSNLFLLFFRFCMIYFTLLPHLRKKTLPDDSQMGKYQKLMSYEELQVPNVPSLKGMYSNLKDLHGKIGRKKFLLHSLVKA